MLNNSGPRYKRSQLEKMTNCDIMWLVTNSNCDNVEVIVIWNDIIEVCSHSPCSLYYGCNSIGSMVGLIRISSPGLFYSVVTFPRYSPFDYWDLINSRKFYVYNMVIFLFEVPFLTYPKNSTPPSTPSKPTDLTSTPNPAYEAFINFWSYIIVLQVSPLTLNRLTISLS